MIFETGFLAVYAHGSTSDWALGREMFALLERPEHDLRPSRIWGHDPVDHERYTDKIRYAGPESVQPLWLPPRPDHMSITPHWENKGKRRTSGSMQHFSTRKTDGFPLAGGPTINGIFQRDIDFQLLFNRLCLLFGVEEAKLLPSKWGISGLPEDARFRARCGLEEIITDSPWICLGYAHSMCLSPRHMTDAIFESVIAQGFPHAELGAARMVAVSDSIFDVVDKPDWYNDRQNLLKRLLNPNGRKLKMHRHVGPGQWEEYWVDP